MAVQNISAPIPVVTINPTGKTPEAAAPVVPVVPAPVMAKPPEQTPEERQKAQQFAALARTEKRIQAEREAFKAERAAFEKERLEARAVLDGRAQAKTRPLEAIKALGLSYEELTNAQLADGRASPELLVSSVRDEVAALKAELRAEKERSAADSKAATEANNAKVMTDFRTSVVEQVKAAGDEFELINAWDSHGLVSSLIETEHAKTGVLLTTKEAAAKVEEYLTEQAKKALAAKKFQQSPKQAVGSAQPRSLTNDMTASSSSGAQPARTEQERFSRALAALSK